MYWLPYVIPAAIRLPTYHEQPYKPVSMTRYLGGAISEIYLEEFSKCNQQKWNQIAAYVGAAVAPVVTETPTSSLPQQNMTSWTAAPWMAAPAIARIAVIAMPHLRPQLSMIGPAIGMAITDPTKTMATLRASVVVESLKYSVYEGNICRPFYQAISTILTSMVCNYLEKLLLPSWTSHNPGLPNSPLRQSRS